MVAPTGDGFGPAVKSAACHAEACEFVELDGLRKNAIVLNLRSQSPARSAGVEK